MCMEMRQIRYFVAIAEEEHFGRAAERLRIAQPALSRQMRLLEAELGFKLFERLPRGVRLNSAGSVMLSEMRDLQSQLARSIATARATAEGSSGILRLSLIESVAWHGIIPDGLKIFRHRFPGVRTALSTMPTVDQLERLRLRQTDAAIVYNPLNVDDLVSIPLTTTSIVLAMPVGCPLLDLPEIRIRDLKGYSLIAFQRAASPKLYDDLSAALVDVDFERNHISEPTNETEMLALVSTGAGLALSNKTQIWRRPDGVRFAPIADLDVTQSLQLLHRPGDCSPALSAFLDILEVLVAERNARP